MTEEKPQLSIVVPVFNEEEVLEEFYRVLSGVLSRMTLSHETIFVDDGSRDGTLGLLEGLRRSDPTVRVIEFSRNFGHQSAMAAGLDHARGAACVLMDADLQDPPELLPDMVAKWREGFEVVYAVRRTREGETIFKLWTAKLFYRTLRVLSGVDLPVDTGDFRLMDRAVVEALTRLPERNRYLRGLVSWIGFKQTGVLFDRPPRAAGVTKFSLWKMMRFAWDGVTSFSHFPLRVVTFVGTASFAGSVVLLAWVFYVKFIALRTVPGWTSLIGVVLLLGGVQLLALGVLGEYIGRIFDEAKQRPLYVVRRALGFDEKK